jgi:hypothetical protein
MRPHTAASIAFLNFLYLKSGDVYSTPEVDGAMYELEVSFPKSNPRFFYFVLKSSESNKLRVSVDKFWSCQLEIYRSSNTFDVYHQHSNNTGSVERFDLFPGEDVRRGKVSLKDIEFRSGRIARSITDFDYGKEVLELQDERSHQVLCSVIWRGKK